MSAVVTYLLISAADQEICPLNLVGTVDSLLYSPVTLIAVLLTGDAPRIRNHSVVKI